MRRQYGQQFIHESAAPITYVRLKVKGKWVEAELRIELDKPALLLPYPAKEGERYFVVTI